MDKAFRDLIREAERQGWRAQPISSGFLLLAPDGAGKVTIHGTPSDHRALQNTISRMRRRGFRWPPKTEG